MNDVNIIQSGTTLGLNYGDGQYSQNDPFQSLTSPNYNYSFPSSGFIKLSARKVNFQPNSLGNTTHIYTSPLYGDMTALANYFADWGCSYDIEEGPTHKISVSVPWDTITQQDFNISDYVSEQWEIIPNMDTKSIIVNGLLPNPFNPPTATGNYVVLPDVLKIAVQRAYENKQLSIMIPSASLASSSSIYPFIPFAQQTLNYLRGGIEGVPSYTQTLKRTAVIDIRNSNRAFQKEVDAERQSLNSQGTINYMMGTSDIIHKYDVNNTVASLLMPSYSKQMTVGGLEPVQYWAYAGWLVQQPTFQFITRNKVQLSQLFIWSEWMEGLYYINSNASQFPIIYSPSTNPAGYGA